MRGINMQNNEDVVSVGIEPFLHFLIIGAKQGRRPNSLSLKAADNLLVQLLAVQLCQECRLS